MAIRTLVLLLLVACSSKKEAPAPTANPTGLSPTAPVATAPDNSPRGLCARGCTKLLSCAGAGDDQLAPCVESCAAGSPQQAQIEQLEAMTCEQLASAAGGGAAPAAGGGGCAADCQGCVGDDTSCYAAAGGAHGIPCDPCCCAPGGPSPVWRTE